MNDMTQSIKQKDLAGFNFVMSRRLYELLQEKASVAGMTRAEFTRRILAKAMGKPSLATMPRSIGRKLRNGSDPNE